MIFKAKMYLASLLCRALFRVLYSRQERIVLRASILIVLGNPRIPLFDINAKRGREYRRDEACFQAWSGTGMKQSKVNFGVELAYWLKKKHTPDDPKRHSYSVGVE